jgi:hypothetical protein
MDDIRNEGQRLLTIYRDVTNIFAGQGVNRAQVCS